MYGRYYVAEIIANSMDRRTIERPTVVKHFRFRLFSSCVTGHYYDLFVENRFLKTSHIFVVSAVDE